MRTSGIPITTTIHGWRYALGGLECMREAGRMEVCSIQEYHRHSPRLAANGKGA